MSHVYAYHIYILAGGSTAEPRGTTRALAPLLGYLRGRGVVAEPVLPGCGPDHVGPGRSAAANAVNFGSAKFSGGTVPFVYADRRQRSTGLRLDSAPDTS